MTVTPDQPGKGIAGVDYNPYTGQENDDLLWNPFVLLCHIIAFILSLFGKTEWAKKAKDCAAYFPFHNYLQVHVAQNALPAGFNTTPRDGTLGKFVFPKIPECPILWQPVAHYWNFVAAVGILLYDVIANIRLILILVVLWNAVRLGKVTISDAYNMTLQQIGVGF